MKKRVLSLALTLCLVICLLPASSIGALATPSSYTITVTVNGSGIVQSATGSTTVAYGENIGFFITPIKGWYLGYITVDGVQQIPSSTYTFYSVTASHTLEVWFMPDSTGTTTPVDPGTTTPVTPPVVIPALPYTDVAEADWFYSAVKFCKSNDLMSGVTATTFVPNAELSRAMLVTVLWRMAGSPSSDKTTAFTDVAESAWYSAAVSWCYANKIATGSGGLFLPDTTVTREEMATFLYRYAAYKGSSTTATNDLSSFNDKDSVSGFALTAVKWAVAKGYLSGLGDGSLAPGGKTTRAQFAMVLSRFYTGS